MKKLLLTALAIFVLAGCNNDYQGKTIDLDIERKYDNIITCYKGCPRSGFTIRKKDLSVRCKNECEKLYLTPTQNDQ